MKRGILIACLIGLVAAVGARAQDEPPASSTGQHHSMRGGMDSLLPPRLLEKLALTGEQKTKYDTLNASFKKDLAKLEGSHSSSSESSSTNSTSSTSSNNSTVANRKAIHQLHKSYIDQLRPSLTSEQITTLDNAAENLRNNRGGHSGTNSAAKPSTPPPDNS